MALWLKEDGRILCAAENEPESGDVYLTDGLQQRLADMGVLWTPDHGASWEFRSPTDAGRIESEAYLRKLDEAHEREHAALLSELYDLRVRVRR